MAKKTIRFLSSPQDTALLQPILDALQSRGVGSAAAGDSLGKNELLLAALSESFYRDEALRDRLLTRLAAGAENVLPLQLDASPIPDELKNALYARNIIPAAGRDAGHTAERILAALPKAKNRLPLILSAAGLVLLAVVGLFLWRSAQGREAVPAMAQEEIVIPVAFGLTEADLAEIESVIIVGDRAEFYRSQDIRQLNGYPDWDHFAYRDFDDSGAHFYSRDDGHEFTMARYDDLRFLSLMPNLHFLYLSRVEANADALPDLAGSDALRAVMLADCVIPDLSWLAGSSIRHTDILNSEGSIRDFSPLSACEKLESVHIDLIGTQQANLSGFAPPKLNWLWINNGQDLRGTLDLSALAACDELNYCKLETDIPVTDLSFLNGAKLQTLEMYNLHQLRDISALSGFKALEHLDIHYCERITDYTPIAGCTALRDIHFQCDFNPDAMSDASFLSALPRLNDIGLYGCNLRNMDFLEGIAAHQSSINLGFAGNILDYSGLAAIKHFDYLHVNPRGGWEGNRGGDFSAVLPYIQDAQIDSLMLYTCRGVDLSRLPAGVRDLSIRYGDLRDLSGLPPYSLHRLVLWNCQYLRSLEGIEALATLQSKVLELDIFGCPRLTDYAALDGAKLGGLKLVGLYTLPALDRFSTGYLRLESIDGLRDLQLLNGLEEGSHHSSIDLVGLDGLRDLTPLRRLQIDKLMIPPQVADQAEELREDGVIQDYEVAYPDGSWQPFEGDFALLSLSELETLPKSILRRVTDVCIAGNEIIPRDAFDLDLDWEHRDENGIPALSLRDRETDEMTPLSPGIITDLSVFSQLTGLKRLRLWGQPLESLDGIQALTELEDFSAVGSPALTDASALFALPQLREAELEWCAVDSIQGVQNLRELRWLNISNTGVDDLSPLAACDLSAAYEDGGFCLHANELPLDAGDFESLGSVRRFRELNFTDADPDIWIPALAHTEIEHFGAAGDLRSNEDLAAFAAGHPELRSLWLGWAEGITDLRCLLSLEGLEYVGIHRDMTEAIESLSGTDHHFELEISG